MNTYRLVNPYIKGEFKSKITSKNSQEAAKKFYKDLSEHFNNNVPKFYFTIQKGGSGKGKFYHFVVKESKKKNEVSYSIQPYTIPGETEAVDGFITNFKKFKGRFNTNMKGGAKRKSSKRRSRKKSRDDMDEYDYEDDYYRDTKTYVPVTSQPIYYMYYDPLVYKLDSVFIPTWYAYITPYVELNTTGLYIG